MCISLHHSVDTVRSPFLNLAVSPTFLALHDLRCSCHVFVGCRTAGHHDRLGHTDFSPASISFPQRKQWVGPGFSTFSCMSCFFFPHSMPHCTTGAELPVMNMSTKANLSVHCSIPVPARNLGTSCFCVEVQFLYMVNVLSKSQPGRGRENAARQQHCPEKAPAKLDWPDCGRSGRTWTSVALPGRTPSPWSPQTSPCFAATCVHPLSAPQHRSLLPGGDTAHCLREPEAHRR